MWTAFQGEAVTPGVQHWGGSVRLSHWSKGVEGDLDHHTIKVIESPVQDVDYECLACFVEQAEPY